jgi:hypothetical protein
MPARGGPATPVTAATHESAGLPLPPGWLETLAAATAGRWQATAAADAHGGALTLLQHGRAQGSVAFGDERVTVCEAAAGRCETAPIDAATAAALRARLMLR